MGESNRRRSVTICSENKMQSGFKFNKVHDIQNLGTNLRVKNNKMQITEEIIDPGIDKWQYFWVLIAWNCKKLEIIESNLVKNKGSSTKTDTWTANRRGWVQAITRPPSAQPASLRYWKKRRKKPKNDLSKCTLFITSRHNNSASSKNFLKLLRYYKKTKHDPTC